MEGCRRKREIRKEMCLEKLPSDEGSREREMES